MLSLSRQLMRAEASGPESDSLTADGAGDHIDAFSAIYEHHLPAIYGYLLGFTGNEEEAADLTQEVFARAFRSRDRFEQRGPPLVSWLYRIARNAATDAYRRRRPTLPLECILERARPTAERPVEVIAIRDEEQQRLAALVTRLPEQQRVLLALRFGNELTCVQIAEIVGRSEAAVKKQLERTLRRLREDYGER